MSIKFISKGEADAAAVRQSLIDQKEIVLFKNRFGREVELPRYNAKKMVRRMEGTIIADPSPKYAELMQIREEYLEKFGTQANDQWSFYKIQKMLNPEIENLYDKNRQAKQSDGKPAPVTIIQQVQAPQAPVDSDRKKELVAQYKEKFGKRPGPQWDEATIESKLFE